MSRADMPQSTAASASAQISSSTRIITLIEGVYALTARKPSGDTLVTHGLSLPAVQILAAPFARSDGKLDLVPAPNLQGTWMIQPGDTVLAHAKGGACHVMVMSLSLPGEDVLAIEIHRLDSQGSTAVAKIPQDLNADTGPRAERRTAFLSAPVGRTPPPRQQTAPKPNKAKWIWTKS